jgi:hypothetical protein
MALILIWAAALQLNDPDPARWFTIYTAGAVLTALAGFGVATNARRRALARCAVLVMVVCLTWAAALAASLLGAEFPDLGAPMTPDHPEVEWAREMLGLLIVAFWTAGVAWRLSGAERDRG